ncbi:DUF1906 domain-containing protein [Nocardioides sp. BP30]|uniref:glycoside hydrolase domain-containing protein n=1 Tax=Nocardioides sp. BP30 TaxID=3036374 RepID=UPI0024686710|nr:glycoside hydrolase domain-containing protein [Nocardioides sp. BP30]WGL53065.1 DUF1906 domain-containing protein [Nocardioides sp. BP30]
MSRIPIGLLALVVVLLSAVLAAAPVHAASAAGTPSVTVTPTVGDEMTAFRGTGTGFTPSTSADVSVEVNGNPFTGSYTKTRRISAAGGFVDWVWVWTEGDPYGTYTFTFTDSVSHQAAIAMVTIKHTATGPKPAAGTHLMVDTASAPALATVQAWQSTAPYDAIGVYVPVDQAVDNRHDKVQGNLTQSWVSAVQTGGWHVLPIYVGPQAPDACQSGSFHGMNADPAVAQTQGVAAADDAVGGANLLGIDAAIPVVYDMESYTPGCSAAVQAFLLGWTTELHRLHRPAAVYGGASSVATDLAAAADGDPGYVLPDLFWAATDNRRAAIDSVKDLPPESWKVANQYIFGVTRTYGATSLTVDESAVDASVWPSTRSDPVPDTTAPIVSVADVPRLIGTSQASFTWSGVDAGTGIASYQVRTRRTAGGHAAGAWSGAVAVPATTRSRTEKVRAGEQVCEQVRGVDVVGNASDWTLPACTSRLDDDRSAAPGPGWHRKHAATAYRRTLTTTTRAHAVLTLGRTAGGRLAVAMTGRGSLVVKVAGHRVGALHGSGTHWLGLPRKGKVTLTTSNGRRVSVDGFALTPR